MKKLIYFSLFSILLSACAGFTQETLFSNGAIIYYTGINSNGERLDYSGGISSGMMMQSSYSCASCHGIDGQGGWHTMQMNGMDAPDIRFKALLADDDKNDEEDGHGEAHSNYDLDNFYQAVVLGKHPDGSTVDGDMPRWQINSEDLADLFEFIQTLN